MKTNLEHIRFIFVACFFVNQVGNASQSDSISYNAIDWSQISSNELTAIVKNANPSRIPPKAWGVILKRVDWFQLPTNVQNYISDNVDWSLVPTNVLEYYNQPAEWPNSHQALNICAEIMRSSVDTNWLAMIAEKVTNLTTVIQFTNRLNNGSEAITLETNTDIAHYFEGFSKRLESTLNEYSGYLTNPKLKAYLGEAGYGAEIPSSGLSEGMVYYGFQSEKGPARDIRLLSKVSGERAPLQIIFYPNGRLSQFRVFTLQHKDTALFNENGQLQHFDWIMNDKMSIHIDPDASGEPHVKLIALGKHLPLKFQ